MVRCPFTQPRCENKLSGDICAKRGSSECPRKPWSQFNTFEVSKVSFLQIQLLDIDHQQHEIMAVRRRFPRSYSYGEELSSF